MRAVRLIGAAKQLVVDTSQRRNEVCRGPRRAVAYRQGSDGLAVSQETAHGTKT